MNQSQQLNLFEEKKTLLSIDPKRNRYRAYQVELKRTQPKQLIKKWGRVEKKGGRWQLRNNKWQQEIEVGKDVDEVFLEKLYLRTLKNREQNGYRYYIGRLFL